MRRIAAGLRTLRVRIVAIVALCWLLPTLALGVYMSGIFFSALRTKTEQALVAGASHAQELTVKEIDRILKKSKDVTYDEQLWGYTASLLSGELNRVDYIRYCRTYWSRMFQRERGMYFTAFLPLVSPVSLMQHTTQDVDSLLQFRAHVVPTILELGKTLDTRSRFAYVNGNLYHVRNLYNRRLERFGMIVLGIIPSDLFAPVLREDTLWIGRADILLDEYAGQANQDDPLTLDDFQAGLRTTQSGEITYANSVRTSDYTFAYRIRLDRSIIYGQGSEYYRIIFALLLALLPVEALIMWFIHRNLTRPLSRLAEATQRLAGGDLGITVPAKGADEITGLGSAFNAMSLRIHTLIEKSYREELALRDAHISALQSRINPHFLNNALELMNWQARLDGADTVSHMIEAMSTLLNAAMDRIEQRIVPLKSELEVSRAYFFFIRLRFEERVVIEETIDETLLAVLVPRLVIQTLVENAVEHGISPAGGGAIRLHIYAREGALTIDVRNNGKGLTAADQEKVNRLLSDPGDTSPEHIGIRNINLRLKLIYPEGAGLTLSADENGDTLARVVIPADGIPAREIDWEFRKGVHAVTQ